MRLRLAPEIRRAASALGDDLNNLKETLDRNARFESVIGNQVVSQKLRPDGQMSSSKLKDGSLVVPETDAMKTITSMLVKSGATPYEIKIACTKWGRAPQSSEVILGHGLRVRKWENVAAKPTYSEAPLSLLVPLKVTYEFVALIMGSAIYDRAFDTTRDILRTQNEHSAGAIVEYMWATKPDAFHGIAFKGNKDTAQFQVRFFGLLAYTVTLPKVRLHCDRFEYTHFLPGNQENLRIRNDKDA